MEDNFVYKMAAEHSWLERIMYLEFDYPPACKSPGCILLVKLLLQQPGFRVEQVTRALRTWIDQDWPEMVELLLNQDDGSQDECAVAVRCEAERMLSTRR